MPIDLYQGHPTWRTLRRMYWVVYDGFDNIIKNTKSYDMKWLFSNLDICLSYISIYFTYHYWHLSIWYDLSNLSPLACPELFQWTILCFPIGAMPHNFNSIHYGPCCHHNGDDRYKNITYIIHILYLYIYCIYLYK